MLNIYLISKYSKVILMFEKLIKIIIKSQVFIFKYLLGEAIASKFSK